MSDEPFQAQVGAYLRGELSPAQAAAFGRALAGDGALRDLLREREKELERLTLGITPQVEPPAAVRERLLAATAAEPRAFAPSPAVATGAARDATAPAWRRPPTAPAGVGSSAFRRRALAAAAVLALLALCAGLWGRQEQARRENVALREQVRGLAAENDVLRNTRQELTVARQARERLEGEVAALREQAGNIGRDAAALREQLDRAQRDLLAARDQDVFTRLQVGLLHPPPGALPPAPAPAPASPPLPATAGGIALWDPRRQQGMLLVENLPVPRPDQDYQVWVADPTRLQPVPSGVFHPARVGGKETLRFVTNERIERASQFMVTLERKGGVNRITGPAVLESSAPRR